MRILVIITTTYSLSKLFVTSDELLKWEEKMVRQGNVDLVRAEMLIEPNERKSKPRKQKTKSTEEPDLKQ